MFFGINKIKEKEGYSNSMRRKYWFYLSVISLLTTGCSERNQQPSLEELSLVTAIAFDYVDESSMMITVAMPQPAEEASKPTQTTSVKASLMKEGIIQISNKSDRMVSLSQLRVAFFSEEFARKGKMEEVIEYLYRDTEVRENVHLGIVSGEAGEIITSEYPDKPTTSVYLTKLLEPRLYTSFSPFTDLHIFIYDTKNPVLDTQAPYLEMKEGIPEISKLALFKDHRIVDTISKDDGKIIQVLTGLTKAAPMDFVLKENEEVLLEFIKSQVNIKGNNNLESPKVTISLTLQGSLDEYNGEISLTSNAGLKELERNVEKKLETDIQDLINKFKTLQIDPVGFSEKFRMRYKGKWTRELTMQILEKAEFEVNIDVKIISIGTLEES